jgi:Peptidase S24-like
VSAPELRALARAGLFEHYRAARTTAWIEATGTSMVPLIHPGDRLLVAFGERADHTGQVILCAVGEAFVAHRLVAHRLVADRSDTPAVRLIAKGDAEVYPDRAVSPAEVLGVVQAVRHHDGRVVTAGLDDTSGAIVALASWWGGSTARFGRRLARHAPPSAGRPLLTTLLILSRVPTRLLTALMPWLVQETRAEGR